MASRVLDVGARASRQSLGRSALQHHILDATLLAELALGLAAAIGIDHKDVWFHNIYRWHEVHDAASLVDEGILDITDRFHHEKTFLLRVESLMVLIAKDGLIGADTDVKVSILGCLAEKFHMTTMQKVVAATYKYFFHRLFLSFLLIWQILFMRICFFRLQNYNFYSNLTRKSCTNIHFCAQTFLKCAILCRNIWVKDKKMVLLRLCLSQIGQ